MKPILTCFLMLTVATAAACGSEIEAAPKTPGDGLPDDGGTSSEDGGDPDGGTSSEDRDDGGDAGRDGQAPPPGDFCVEGGFCWPRPTPFGTTMSGVWGSSPSEVWAIGSRGTILHYDGASWKLWPKIVTREHLSAIWGSAASDVWAVGERGTILHYDGVDWTSQPSSRRGQQASPCVDRPSSSYDGRAPQSFMRAHVDQFGPSATRARAFIRQSLKRSPRNAASARHFTTTPTEPCVPSQSADVERREGAEVDAIGNLAASVVASPAAELAVLAKRARRTEGGREREHVARRGSLGQKVASSARAREVSRPVGLAHARREIRARPPLVPRGGDTLGGGRTMNEYRLRRARREDDHGRGMRRSEVAAPFFSVDAF